MTNFLRSFLSRRSASLCMIFMLKFRLCWRCAVFAAVRAMEGNIGFGIDTGWQPNYTMGPTFHPHPIWWLRPNSVFELFRISQIFYRRNKHKNNYKVDYQRLKDLSWDNIWVKSINTKYDKIIHFKLHTEYEYFWELFLKWTEFIPKMQQKWDFFGD